MPPGPVLQYINVQLHIEPLSTVVYTIYWSSLLTLSLPLSVAVLTFRCIRKLVRSQESQGFNYYDPSKYQQDSKPCELAVFITGCDTGFGKEIAQLAASKGFVVFAACLQTESFAQFKNVDNVIPLQVDVTNNDQVCQAAQRVKDWIQAGEKETKGKKRVLHAILNNAGIGICGPVDWLDLAAFQKVMDGKYLRL
jgi:hypothetical protein